jgi:hypothetical protein
LNARHPLHDAKITGFASTSEWRETSGFGDVKD